MFARISVSMLEPDLVIMDEFQRFKFLLSSDDSELGILAHSFLSGHDTRVLLLSATPYKLYSISFSLCHRQILLSLVLRSSDFCVFNLGQGSLNCWFSGSVYTLPVLAIYRWHSRRKRVLKKNPL